MRRHRLRDLVAVAALGDDLETVLGTEDADDATAHDRLVVDDDDADHDRHDSLLGAARIGSRASTRQPSIVVPASRLPPSARARSLIPISPK